jgi:hypothetical protein
MLKIFRVVAILLIAAFLLSAYGERQAAAQPVSGTLIQFEKSYDLLGESYVPPYSYVCKLISFTPALNTEMRGLNQFKMKWTVKNIGVSKWDKEYFDYKYIDGTHFEIYKSRYDLPTDVLPNAQVTLTVPMVAPSKTGWYWGNWALILSPAATNRCKLPIRIHVVAAP